MSNGTFNITMRSPNRQVLRPIQVAPVTKKINCAIKTSPIEAYRKHILWLMSVKDVNECKNEGGGKNKNSTFAFRRL